MKTNKDIASFVLKALKNAGADAAQCVVSRGLADEINVDSGEFSLMRSLYNNKISMTAIKDSKKGSIGINSFMEDVILKAAKQCVESAEASVEDDAVCISELTENRDFVSGVLEPDRDRFFDRLQEYLENVKADYPKIILEQVIAHYSSSESFFANTNGVEYSHNHGSYALNTMFSASEGDCSTSFNYCDVRFDNLDEKILDLGQQRDLYKRSEEQLKSCSFEGKFCGTAVLTPLCLEDFLSMAFGNFVEDMTIIDGTSPWRNALDTKVASEDLTVSYVPLDDRVIGGERYTTDGYISENYDVIKNGILKSFSLSEYAARKTGNERAKNTSSALFMKAGEQSLEEIISKIDKGILVYRFSGGSPAVNGDFSGVAKNSFLIENGKITSPVTETMISGNLADMLKNVSGISREVVCDGSAVLPWAAFEGITVSGK